MNSSAPKRKVCFVITSFIHYSRNFLILEELNKRPDVELHVLVGGAALVPKYTSKTADLISILKEEGYENVHQVYFTLEGDVPVLKAKTVGFGVVEVSTVYNAIQPDLVVVRGDRFEVLGAVIAAVYMNIPVAHIEGGDVSGTIDESVRHAITKLVHIHFPTNDDARDRILQMGENPKHVYNYGSPDVEVVKQVARTSIENFESLGSGAQHFSVTDDYLMVMFHPVTTGVTNLAVETKLLLQVIYELDMPTLWFWPNSDYGADIISTTIREFKDKTPDHQVRFLRYIPPKQFLSLLSNTQCLVGNSSAGLKECSILGVPVVNIGSRQDQRLCPENVSDTDFDATSIAKTVRAQLEHGLYPPSNVYYKKNTAKNVAEKIATSELYVQKKYHS